MAESASKSAEDSGKNGKKKIWLWAGLGAVVLICAGGALYFSMNRGKKSEVAEKPVLPVRYTALKRFVSNLESDGPLHYIEVTVELKSRSPEVPAQVALHRPEIRNAVLNILAAQSLPAVALPAGRESLREKILHSVNTILDGKTGSTAVASGTGAANAHKAEIGPILGVYFTAFVVQ